MTVINTNVSALVAQNAMTVNSRAQSLAMQQLSTGQRINGAKDDAAGLAISAKMTSQIKGLDQAVRNANDGISLLQTADGAMIEVTNMLQRMRELAVQSSNDTNVTADRTALNAEFTALKTEIGRVGLTTQWNGTNILDNTKSGGFTFQVGANNSTDQQINLSIASVSDRVAGTTAAVAAMTVASATGVKQASTVTLTSATPAVGDKITLTLGSQSFDYTVAQSDYDATALTFQTNVAHSMKLGFAANTALAANYTATDAAGVLTLTSAAVATSFGLTTSVSGGGLALLGSSNAAAVDTLAHAQTAIGQVDVGIAAINSSRAGIGAVINRLTYAADNLSNVSQNTSASRSRIQDTDYAKSSTELARTQIISQAATAMLAQANQSQQSVLALLK
ncbi:MAG: flagellin, partial [Rhodoferax sp.]